MPTSANNRLPPQLRLKLLSAVIEFMNLSGASETDLRVSFEKILAGLSRQRRRLGGELGKHRIGSIDVSAELLRLWHRDHRFIDLDANPKPLYMNKGRNSLNAAIRQLDPKADAKGILQSMKSVGLIRRTGGGRYLPTTQSAIFRELHPIAIEHVSKTVIHLVSTVCRNTDPARRSLPLIERNAYVPDLDPTARKAFAEFTRVQGMAYLESVDDWLQQRRARRTVSSRRSRKAGVAASVHLVAYLGDEPTSAANVPSTRSPKGSRIKPPPEARA
jgi:hypothetical protein